MGESGRCPRCGSALEALELEQARALVLARRRVEQRRLNEQTAAEVGLDRSTRLL